MLILSCFFFLSTYSCFVFSKLWGCQIEIIKCLFSKSFLFSLCKEESLSYLVSILMILVFFIYVLYLISHVPYLESSQSNPLFRKLFSGNSWWCLGHVCIYGGLGGASGSCVWHFFRVHLKDTTLWAFHA